MCGVFGPRLGKDFDRGGVVTRQVKLLANLYQHSPAVNPVMRAAPRFGGDETPPDLGRGAAGLLPAAYDAIFAFKGDYSEVEKLRAALGGEEGRPEDGDYGSKGGGT